MQLADDNHKVDLFLSKYVFYNYRLLNILLDHNCFISVMFENSAKLFRLLRHYFYIIMFDVYSLMQACCEKLIEIRNTNSYAS